MTPAEINAAIAEWMGWKEVVLEPLHYSGAEGIPPNHPRRAEDGGFNYWAVPNYHGDLNACREAWLHLDEQKQWEFADELDGVIERAMPESDIYRRTAVSLNATAPQRTEALLRTLNLWKE